MDTSIYEPQPLGILPNFNKPSYSLPSGYDFSGAQGGWMVNLDGKKYKYDASGYLQDADGGLENAWAYTPPKKQGGEQVPAIVGGQAVTPQNNPYAQNLEAPQTQPITNPITPPQSGGTTPAPNLPSPQGASVSEQNLLSLTQQNEAAKAAVQAEADKRAAEYAAEIKAQDDKLAELQALQDAGLTGIENTTAEETKAKKEALELERKRFDENYDANQKLIGELDALLTTGNQIIEQMRNTTGLASIMNPRIAKTMSDVQARAGVIEAVINARNGQMSYAQQQLTTTVNILTSIAQDQIGYYETLIDFYQIQKGETRENIATLKKEEKAYLDTKLNLLYNDLERLQQTTDIVSRAMMDPDTALTYASAGVSLNDTPEQIKIKLANYAYSQELKDLSNTMNTNGYTSTPIAGVQPTVVTDSKGNSKNWYKIPAPVSSSPTSGGFELSPGQTRFDAAGNVIASVPANDIAQKLTEVSPGATLFDPSTNQPVYTAPTAAMTTAAGNSPVGTAVTQFPTVALQPGATGSEVTKLQNALVSVGLLNSSQVTGNYDSATTAAVLELQKKLGIDYSSGPGYYGPKTMAALKGTGSSSSSSSGGGTGGGKALTTVGFPPQTSQADVTELEHGLTSGVYAGNKISNGLGPDGFIDPAGYVTLMNFWISQGGTKQAFLDKFPVKKFLNPANDWVWGQLGITNPNGSSNRQI